MVSEPGPSVRGSRAGAVSTLHYYVLTITREMLSSTFRERLDPVRDALRRLTKLFVCPIRRVLLRHVVRSAHD